MNENNTEVFTPSLFILSLLEVVKSVDMGYRTFEICPVSNPHEQKQKVWGAADFDFCKIVLDDNIEHDLGMETLVHEIVHCLLNLFNIDDQANGKIREISNEELTTIVSRGLMMLFKLNPNLINFINEGLKPKGHLPEIKSDSGEISCVPNGKVDLCSTHWLSKPVPKPEILSD
jgi:hypothetical protein